jgi:hypothetical protein
MQGMPKIVRFEEVILFPQSHLVRSHGNKLQTPSHSRKGPAYVLGGLPSSFEALTLLRVATGLIVHVDRRMICGRSHDVPLISPRISGLVRLAG